MNQDQFELEGDYTDEFEMSVEKENIGDDVIEEEIEGQSEEMVININVPSDANNNQN